MAIARFNVGDTVTVLVGSKAGDHATVEHVVWSERDRCHYFYLEQVEHPLIASPTNVGRAALPEGVRSSIEPTGVSTRIRKLSRGYRADELAEGLGDTLS